MPYSTRLSEAALAYYKAHPAATRLEFADMFLYMRRNLLSNTPVQGDDPNALLCSAYYLFEDDEWQRIPRYAIELQAKLAYARVRDHLVK